MEGGWAEPAGEGGGFRNNTLGEQTGASLFSSLFYSQFARNVGADCDHWQRWQILQCHGMEGEGSGVAAVAKRLDFGYVTLGILQRSYV